MYLGKSLSAIYTAICHQCNCTTKIKLINFLKKRIKAEEPEMSVYKKALQSFETELFIKVLHRSQGYESRAAKRLGLARGTFRTKCKSYGIDTKSIRRKYRKTQVS